MNLQKNRKWVVYGGVCGFIIVLEIFFLVRANIELSRQKQELRHSYRRLSQLYNRNPFPSQGNVALLHEDLDGLQFHLSELTSTLKGDPFPQDAVEATDFSARAQDVIERFKKRAEQSGVVLPDSLEVGFADYASGGAVPDIRNVPRLSRQLYSVERVADILVQGGVVSIDRLTRDAFETTAEPSRTSTRRRPRRNVTEPSAERTPLHLIASDVHPENLYYMERVAVSFSAKEEVVWRVLNFFASAPHFMVVRELSHTTQSSILNYNPEALQQSEAEDDETLNYLAEGILVGEKALSRPERIIVGNELVQVSLVVAVYNFEPEAAAK